MKPNKCTVYRSENKAETYLYLLVGKKIEDLPLELQEVFGTAEPIMMLTLTPERKLSRVDVGKVMEALSDQGFYLQLLPEFPVEDEITRSIR